VNRRALLTLLGGAGAAPSMFTSLAAFGETAGKRPMIGYLAGASQAAADRSSTTRGFLGGLRDQGYEESRDIEIARYFADGYLDRLPALAQQMVRLKPDVVLAPATITAVALRAATDTIPIVCPLLENPVRLKLVASESRP